MEKTIKTLVIALFLMAGFQAEAKDLDVAIAKEQILRVGLEKVKKGDVLTLVDAEGKVLYREENLGSDLYKSLSLELVPDGKYFLRLEDSNSVYTKEILKKDKALNIQAGSKVIFKPKFIQDKSSVKLSYTNLAKENVHILVYDASGNVINKLEDDSHVVKKTLDFSTAPAGTYSIALISEDRNYYHN
jgi:uncharacterized protein YxjI